MGPSNLETRSRAHPKWPAPGGHVWHVRGHQRPQGGGRGTEKSQGTEEGKIVVFVNPHTWINPEDYDKLRADIENIQKQLEQLALTKQDNKQNN
jgi:hypothetical protein